MQTLTAAEIQVMMKKAKTLEQSHSLAVLLAQTLRAEYQGRTYNTYKQQKG
jgi:hypothetical protein